MAKNIWHGKIVRLRAVESEDWQTFFRWFQDTDFDRLTDSLIFPFSSEAVKKWATELALTQDPKDDEFRWVIENPNGEFVGTINTHTCDRRNGTFQYGVAIRCEHWRKGHATEAIGLVLKFFFHEMGYQKVNVHSYAFNEGSIALHHKLGFREEGRLRSMLYSEGKYHDWIMLGMTRREFERAL
jgi:RimJ/RimL family protein N-acetyltransferase